MEATRIKQTGIRARERGQVLPLAALLLTALLGLGALAIDAGLAYTQRTRAQGAADNAALAAAQEASAGGTRAQAIQAATEYAQRNGYKDGVNGVSVVINNPPASGPRAGDSSFYEVKIGTAAPNVFYRILGKSSGTVGARAVAGTNSTKVLPYNFASLRSDCGQHTLKVQLGGTLTVNGGLYVNSGDSDKKDGSGNPLPCGNESKGAPGYGDAFDVFGTGGKIVAQKIMVHGGWETHNNDQVCVPAGCCVPPGPCSAGPLIGQPILPDPLASLAPPQLSSYPVQHGSAAAPSALSITSGTVTLQPGVYYGGIAISSTANVTFAAGVYIMAGGGLSVTGGASLNAAGVMVYNTNATAGGKFTAVNLATTGSVTLSPPRSGLYAGLTIFQDRAATTNIILQPGNGINGLSGTMYAPGWNANSSADPSCPGSTKDSGAATVVVGASGTANLQVISAQILICGSNATFSFNSSGFANSSLSLVE